MVRFLTWPIWLAHWLMFGAIAFIHVTDVFMVLHRRLDVLAYLAALPVAVVASPVLIALPWVDQWVHGGQFRMFVLMLWIGWPLSGAVLGLMWDELDRREADRRWREMNQ